MAIFRPVFRTGEGLKSMATNHGHFYVIPIAVLLTIGLLLPTGPVHIHHRSHHFATQSSHFVDRAY